MLRKGKILERLADIGIVAVVRGESVAEGVRISKACAKGGIPAMEVTYTVPGATEVIKALKEQDVNNEMIIGAGTVLDAATARIAILAGAEFIVSPAFDKETAKLCNLYQIPYMPGCMTITEMTTAMQYGADIIKLFPGSAFGPSFVKAVKAPLPQANIMPTGGVSLENMEEWFKNGVIAVGAGGKLASGTDEEIIATAQAFRKKLLEIRSK